MYERYHAAIEQAIELVLCHASILSNGPLHSEATKAEQDRFAKRLTATRTALDQLERAVAELKAVLPIEARNTEGLDRHLYWSSKRLRERQPEECAGDARDILVQDLPHLLTKFNSWYEKQSQLDPLLSTRLQPLVRAGHTNSAVREAWAVFKTRCIDAFDLPAEIDGWRLAERLFGDNGVMQDRMNDSERRGYQHMLKGLYALSRNPIAHNDSPPNPAEADAVLTLVSRTLARLEEARQPDPPRPTTDAR